MDDTLFVACRSGNLEVIKYLVSLGCDHKIVMLHKDIKYDVLCKVKTKLNMWLSKNYK